MAGKQMRRIVLTPNNFKRGFGPINSVIMRGKKYARYLLMKFKLQTSETDDDLFEIMRSIRGLWDGKRLTLGQYNELRQIYLQRQDKLAPSGA